MSLSWPSILCGIGSHISEVEKIFADVEGVEDHVGHLDDIYFLLQMGVFGLLTIVVGEAFHGGLLLKRDRSCIAADFRSSCRSELFAEGQL